MERCIVFLENAYYEFEICYVSAGTSGSESLFEVSDYLAALALLLVVYTISDSRNKIRLALASLPIYSVGFWLFLAVLCFKVVVELWFYNAWPILAVFDNKLLLDSILLVPCVAAIFYWIYISYVQPPKFSTWNSRKYFWTYQQLIHNGTAEEVKVALHELNRSARSIVRYATAPPDDRRDIWNPGRTEQAATDMILLLGNRRICSEMARTSPDTAATFFHEIAVQEKFHLPYGTFAQNVAGAMLSDKSSAIFHEDSGWDSGWSGYAQLYSAEIFANPKHISALSRTNSSPLDVRYSIRQNWDAENWEAYSRVALMYFQKIVDGSPSLLSHPSTYQILRICKSLSQTAYQLDGRGGDFSKADEFKKLSVLSLFLKDLIDLLDDSGISPPPLSRLDQSRVRKGFHEKLAETIFEVIFDAARVRHPAWVCWTVSHNTVWAGIFSSNGGDTSRWIFRRVSRMIYEEIIGMDRYFNFKGAAYLGFCLNVLGLETGRRGGWRDREDPLRLAILRWTCRNYSRMREESPKVAEACLHGGITFDESTCEIVKRYQNETGRAPSEARLKVASAQF